MAEETSLAALENEYSGDQSAPASEESELDAESGDDKSTTDGEDSGSDDAASDIEADNGELDDADGEHTGDGGESIDDAADDAAPLSEDPETDPAQDAIELTLVDPEAEALPDNQVMTAASTSGQELYYSSEEYYTWDGTVITGCTTPSSNQDRIHLTIPAKATAIGEGAFKDNRYITTVAFAGNSIEIRDSAFRNCQMITSIDLPQTVTFAGTSQFYGCLNATSIHLPEGLIEIPDDAFHGWQALQSVTIPDSVTRIGQSSFYYCLKLESVTLPKGLKEIAGQAFRYCTSLKAIDLPDTLTTLGAQSFDNCTSLTEVTIPAGLTQSTNAFAGCSSLARLQYAEGTTTAYGVGATNATVVTLPDTVTAIDQYAFQGYTKLMTINLPSSLQRIGGAAFSGCTSLREINLPDAVETIGSQAFQGCTSLTTVNIDDTSRLTTIDSQAFSGCSALKDIGLPDSLGHLRYQAFASCTSLIRMRIPPNVQYPDSSTFKGCTGLIVLQFGEGMTWIPQVGAEYVEQVELPESTEGINTNAFHNCIRLQEINLPASLESIQSGAFTSDTGALDQILELRFADNGQLSYIADDAFNGDSNTRNVPVYCVSGSKAYKYFVNRVGFTVVSSNSITYVLNGGTNYASNPTSYTTGDDLKFYAASRDGYFFDGWYTDAACTKHFLYNKDTTNGNLTLYAKWDPMTYSITYDLAGGSLPTGKTNPAAYTADRAYTLVAPSKEGLIFAGWQVNGTDTVITNNVIAADTCIGDLSLTALWREYAYQIIWNKNAKDATGTMNASTVTGSETFTIPAGDYNRAGYDLTGWNTKANGKGTMYYVGRQVQRLCTTEGAKVTLYAQWQKSICEIVYELNGGINHKSNPDSYSAGQKVTLKAPTRTGYIFGGWYTDAACTAKVTTITSALGDVTVYAKWTPITYTITFNKNKGTLPAGAVMSDITATYDKAVTLPANAFTRTGYTFLGWDLTAGSKAAEPVYTDGQAVSNLSTKNKARVTIYAKWKVNQIPITYVLNGTEEDPVTNSAKNPAYVTIEKNVVLSAPTRAGYKFGGWFTDEALETALAKNTILKTTTAPVTVYAKWIENSYTLKLDKNGGTYTVPTEVDGKLVVGKHDYEDEFLLPDGTGASRENYTFTGWNTKKDRSGEHYGLDPETGENRPVSGLATKGTVTLYAEWTPVADKVYTITYHNVDDWDNSKNPGTYSFEKDVKLTNPTRTGYTFKGWYAEDPENNPEAKKVTTISKKTTGAVDLYGVWTENSYTIAYNGNKGTLPKGVKMPAQTVLYSETVTLTGNAFIRKGYTFTGWNTKANGSGDSYEDGKEVSQLIAKAKGKITLYAQWQADEYTITYVGGEDGAEGVVNTNPTTYTILKDVKLVNPTAYGYTFKGWYVEDPEVNPKAKKVTKIAKTTAADVTVYALWSENSYSLRFATNSMFGSSVKAVTNRLYTNQFNIPETSPVWEGYTFQGWALTRDGGVVFHAGDPVTFADIHEAGGVARGLVGTKYFTLYAIFWPNT